MSKYPIHRTDRNEAEIRKAFELAGCRVEKIHQPLDLLVAVPTPRKWINVLVEVKVGNEPLTDAESKFWERWPGPKAVCRNTREVSDLVMQLQIGEERYGKESEGSQGKSWADEEVGLKKGDIFQVEGRYIVNPKSRRTLTGTPRHGARPKRAAR